MKQRSRRNRISLRTPWLWVIGGVVAVAGLLVLNGVCARPPQRPSRLQAVDPSKEDFAIYARMLDSVTVEPDLLADAPPDLAREHARADSLIAAGRTRDAFGRLGQLAGRATGARSFYINAYIGLGRNRLRDQSATVLAFEKALSGSDSVPPRLAARLAFNVGHVFQRFRMPDSARVWYEKSLDLVAGDTAGASTQVPFLPALLNNLGVACAETGDRAAARKHLEAAAARLDTTAATRDAARLRENLVRVSAPAN